MAFLRIINTPPRRIGKTTVGRLVEYARHKGLPLWESARRAGLIKTLSKRAAVEVARFVAMIDSLQLTGGEKVELVIDQIINSCGYRKWLDNSDSEEDRQRLDNLDELLTAGREFDELHVEEGGVEGFLEQTSLVADVDDWESETDRVTMMTLHAAKGLEFPVVFIVAAEEGILPHDRSKESDDQLEEERRLMFVGMTRAQEELQLSVAQQRTIRGRVEFKAPSRFLMELPREEMEVIGQLGYGGADYHTLERRVGSHEGEWTEDWDYADACHQPDDLPELSDTSPSDEPEDSPTTPTTPTKASADVASSAAQRVPLVTAADMSDDSDDSADVAPEQFRLGMVVIHPEYGIGTIVSVGGSGNKRTASVRFAGEANPKSFRLAFSQLRPVGQ